MADAPTVVILAAGQGTRMRSRLAKVLHPLCGRPLVHWVIAAAREAGAGRVLCVVRPGDGVADALPEGVEAVEQREGEGTAAAVMAARAGIDGTGTVVVLSGDHPLVSREAIAELVAAHERSGAAATMLSTEELDPSGYGRVVRDGGGDVERIVETKHADRVPPEVLAIREINMGAYAFEAPELLDALEAVGENDGERYLTAVFGLLRGRGKRIAAHRTGETAAAMGVNTRLDLMAAERLAQRRILERHALAGVTFEAPETLWVEADVEIGADTRIAPGVVLRGATRVGEGCAIGPYTTAIDARIEDGASVVHSYVVESHVGPRASVGPFAYLRPGTALAEGAKVGTFVEVKSSTIGAGAKVPHLSYIGDAEVGEGANVAAGNITANYPHQGGEKLRTVIGAGARTGVDTSFVAPVRVGERAYTGAGSVITEDVPAGALGISRAEQRNVEGYGERVEKERRQREQRRARD